MTAGSSRIAPAPEPRSDARRNRERILAAAGEVFTAKGLDVPVAAVARRAGVGVATLYRHFPTRSDLIAAAFADQLTGCATAIEHALADPDPWRGFCRFVEQVCALQVVDRGFTEAFLRAFGDPDLDERLRRTEQDLNTLVLRAQDAGALRRDFVPADLVLVFRANSGIRAASTDDALAASRRLVAYLLQSFRAAPGDPRRLPPAPPLDVFEFARP